MELSLDNVRMKANKVRDAILEFLGFKVDAGKILGWDPQQFLDNLKQVFSTLPQWFQDLWAEIVGIWTADVVPTLQSIVSFITPVIKTIKSLWNNVSTMLQATFDAAAKVYQTVLRPVIDAMFQSIQSLMSILTNLWTVVIGPILEYIGSGIQTLWIDTILPIITLVLDIIGNLVEAVLGLWNNVLAPLINWFVVTLGPIVTKVVKGVWSIVQSVFTSIGGIITGLLQALKGLTDFLAGVFTKDWTRAWKGLVNVFIGLGNAVLSAAEGVINGIITLVNKAIAFIYNAVVDLINSLLDGLSFIMRVLGIGADLSIGAPPPQIPTVSFPRIPLLAQGGVVDSPTMAMIGEGQYDEAVIPLGNSPQMQDLVQQIADAVNKPDDNAPQPPVEVRVYIGGKEWDAEVYQSARRGATAVGAQPVKENK